MNEIKPDYYEESICACGKGKVIKHIYLVEKNDWAGYTECEGNVEILCPDCSKKYNYKRVVKPAFRKEPTDRSFNIRYYLVPNEIDLEEVSDDYIESKSHELRFTRMKYE